METDQPYKRHNKAMTMDEKLAILRELEAGASRRDIEEMFKCSQSSISRVLLSKESILEVAKIDGKLNGKMETIVPNKEIDLPLTKWAQLMNEGGKVVTVDMVKRKAKELSKELGQDFRYSVEWLNKWKANKNIKLSKEREGSKDILKGLLEKEELQLKRRKLESKEQNEMDFEDKNPEDESFKSDNLNSSTDLLNTPRRTKREYIRRMPAFMKTEGGSQYPGSIYRSRKEKTFLTLLQKLEILQRLKNGERRPDLIIEYKLSQSAMSQIVSDEEKIKKLADRGQNLQMKRVRGGIFKDGEAELNIWVQEKMRAGESLTRTQIKNKAKDIAERLQIDFKASTGWLEKWKARMNLDFDEKQYLHKKTPNYKDNKKNDKAAKKKIQEKYFIEMENVELNDNDLIFPDIVKQEILDDEEYDEEFQNIEDSMTNDDTKEEYLTPQEFYIQTLQKDQEQQHREQQQEMLQETLEEEPEDIKPFIGTPPHLATDPAYQEETLHEQLLGWLNKYKIPPAAATDLLNILQPHLDSVAESTNSSTPQAKNYGYT